ncbi:hypothetical protein GC209_13910 [bacterium]|nr:hypothetical protein [bacterium]
MVREPRSDRKSSGPQSRDARLKAALKANMGRRKAQAQARTLARAEDDSDDKPGDATAADNDKE